MEKTSAQISYNMSRVRAKGSEIEKILASSLRKHKIRFRRHQRRIFGNPDFVMREKNIAIFCDSSFWHGYKRMQTNRHKFKSNQDFWVRKIIKNIERDKLVNKMLRKGGWKVFRFWDFEIKSDPDRCVGKIRKHLLKGEDVAGEKKSTNNAENIIKSDSQIHEKEIYSY